MRRCSSPGKAAPARNWSPTPSTATAGAAGAVREGQSGRHLVVAVRKRDVRPRARRVHRRAPRPQGPLRDGHRRHDLPRRDRRPRPGVAGEAAARAAGPDLRGAGLEPAPDRGRARRRGHQPQPRRHGGARRVPRGPAVPHQPDHAAPAAAARTARRHPDSGQPLPAGRGAGVSSRRRAPQRRRAGLAEEPAVARQRPAVQAGHRAHGAGDRQAGPRRRRLPGDRPRWSRATPSATCCRRSAA